MEASIEHMSRGTLRDVDVLLIVTEPYFRALQTAGRITPLARELGIPDIRVIANKVRSDQDAEIIGDYAGQLNLDVVGAIPWDDAVQHADLANRSLFDYAYDSQAASEIRRIFDHLVTGTKIAEPI